MQMEVWTIGGMDHCGYMLGSPIYTLICIWPKCKWLQTCPQEEHEAPLAPFSNIPRTQILQYVLGLGVCLL